MKMVIAIIQDRDWVKLSKGLTEHGYGVTKLSSTGGFLRQGNTTIMIGVEDEKVEDVLQLIKEKNEIVPRQIILTPSLVVRESCGYTRNEPNH